MAHVPEMGELSSRHQKYGSHSHGEMKMGGWDAMPGVWSLSSHFSRVRETSGALTAVTVRMAVA